jgi:hypothetical protein
MPFCGGDGSVEFPYEVANAADLLLINEYLDSHFIQINDIDLDEIAEWNGIGHYDAPFSGTYNGQNFNIFNMHSIDADTTINGHNWRGVAADEEEIICPCELDFYYNTTTNILRVFVDGGWENIGIRLEPFVWRGSAISDDDILNPEYRNFYYNITTETLRIYIYAWRDVDIDKRGGLFSHVWGLDAENLAVVENVRIVDAFCSATNISGSCHGVFVCDTYFAYFENCHVVRGRILHEVSYGSAGFVGSDYLSEYYGCSADVTIEAEGDWSFADCAGFVANGGCYSTFANCHSKFKIFNSHINSAAGGGGFAGLLWPPFVINQCSANGSFFAGAGFTDVGGFVGRIEIGAWDEVDIQIIQDSYCNTDISQSYLKANMYSSYRISTQKLMAFWNNLWSEVDESGLFNYNRQTFKYIGSGYSLPSTGNRGEIFYRTSNSTMYIYINSWITMPVDTIRDYLGLFAIVYKGTSAPINPEQGWMYYSAVDGDILIFVNENWELLGDHEHPPLIYTFLGQFSTFPEIPKLNDCFYHSVYKQYLYYDGSDWAIARNVKAVPFIWQGESATHPLNPEQYWAYYNTDDELTYIYDNSEWNRCGDNYYGPITNGDLYIRWRELLELDYTTIPDISMDNVGNVGNFVGYFTGAQSSTLDILNCYSIGQTNIRGFDDSFITFYNTYFEDVIVNIANCFCMHSNDPSQLANGLSKKEFADSAIFLDAGWDFVDIWFMDTNYPILKTQKYGFPPVDNVILEKLQLIKQIKNNLKTSIEGKGVTVGNSVFEQYPSLVDQIITPLEE